MFGDLNDCYGRALQQELAEANRIEQEMIETANREADAYYAEMAGIEEQALMETETAGYNVGDAT